MIRDHRVCVLSSERVGARRRVGDEDDGRWEKARKWISYDETWRRICARNRMWTGFGYGLTSDVDRHFGYAQTLGCGQTFALLFSPPPFHFLSAFVS